MIMIELFINTYEGNTLLFKENLLGTLENNILRYENDTDYFLIDLEEAIFQKENLESILKIGEKQALLIMKEFDKSLEIPLINYLFRKDLNKITIEYLLESNENPIKIEIEMRDKNES